MFPGQKINEITQLLDWQKTCYEEQKKGKFEKKPSPKRAETFFKTILLKDGIAKTGYDDTYL